MFKKIVVPLDGSSYAEQSLPAAIRLADKLNAGLLLLRSAEVKTPGGEVMVSEDELIKENEIYLQNILRQISDPALPCHISEDRIEILSEAGVPEDEIAVVAPFEGADLIVMATHSRTGLPLLVKGSLAGRVLKLTTIPVFVIHPPFIEYNQPLSQTLAQSTPLDTVDAPLKLLVTLDGTEKSDLAIEAASKLALQLKARVYLLQVVQPRVPVDYFIYGAGQNIYFDYDDKVENGTKREIEAARKYLMSFEAQLEARGIECTWEVLEGFPADKILRYAKDIKASVLVMATQARGKIGQLMMGSVAEEVVRRSHLPVMLVPASLPTSEHLVHTIDMSQPGGDQLRGV
ncbi:MAG TPA: universal stress protein [Chloroflexia bacterium]|nr:universal stress protein [Chloroflexia bacterium]